MLNTVTIQGRVAFTNYKQGEGDKKSFISFYVSWQTNEKDSETGYYKEMLIRCKAFGQQADFINQYFPDRTQILVEGQLILGNDYTNQNGELIKGSLEVHVRQTHFCGNKESNNSNQQNKTTAPSKPTQTNKPAISKPTGIKPSVKAPMPIRKS